MIYSDTYVIFESCPRYFDFGRLRNYLNELGLKEVSYDEGVNLRPKFVWFRYLNSIDTKITENYLSQSVYVMNNIRYVNCITNKLRLYENMKIYFPEEYLSFMPESFEFKEDTLFNDSDIIITKPVVCKKTGLRASAGKDIVVYDSLETMNIAKKNIEKYNGILASKYIKNPLLFKEKKFHLRSYMIITANECILSYNLLRVARIFHAKNNYLQDDYQNKLIHDTHYGSTDDDYLFPDDMTDILSNNDIIYIYEQIKNICSKMAFILSKEMSIRGNVKYPFHLFGFDVMIDRNLKVWLIECNRYQDLGLELNDERRVYFENIFFDWINDVVLKPIFGNKGNEKLI